MKPTNILLMFAYLTTIGELVMARLLNLHEWKQYKQQHGKVYDSPEEDARRFLLFLATKEQVRLHNANEQADYKLGLNHMSDWTQAERARLRGFRYDPIEHDERVKLSKADPFLGEILADPTPIPSELDWRQVPNRVGPVKNQGWKCAGCWAFSTTGALEGQQVVRNFTKELIPLSEQELIDCSNRNLGCVYGEMSKAMEDIPLIGGIESSVDYGYIDNFYFRCIFDPDKIVMTDSGSIELPMNNATLLKEVVAKFGPVSIGIAMNDRYHSYRSGIFTDPTCGNTLNHASLIVGYGTDAKLGDYWILKDSLSDAWGEGGFMRIKLDICGIGLVSVIPKFDR
uniref:Cathepsin L n=1 Tax=Aceria tosichella TaxID=561515 RepID=A0A6G1S9T0_9ACAR